MKVITVIPTPLQFNVFFFMVRLVGEKHPRPTNTMHVGVFVYFRVGDKAMRKFMEHNGVML